MRTMHFIIIGDLIGRRVKAFVDCLKEMDIHNYQVISWLDVLQDISILEKNLKENTIIRIEPPEKDLEIYRLILGFSGEKGGVSSQEIENIDFSNYQIVAPAQWYEGFTLVLEAIDKILSQNNNIYCMNHFKEAIQMMDKSRTYEILEKEVSKYNYKLPVRYKTPDNYEGFVDMYGHKVFKCFIKLRYGSGGTGVIAYKNNPRLGDERIFTSLNYEIVDGNRIFYSNSKVNVYQDKTKIKELLDWVLHNGAHIEDWIPKPAYNGYFFDTRVFVLSQKVQYVISRLSKTPITNLHLKNRRVEDIDFISKDHLENIKLAAEDVMKVYHQSWYAGIDIISSRSGKPYVIDVNPFGDLFHHLLGTDKNIHYLEIKKAVDLIKWWNR